MNEVLELIGWMALVFAASVGGSYALQTTLRRLRGGVPDPVGAKLRLRTAQGVYRCRVEARGPDGWVITSPLQRDAFVPLQVGEALTVEWPTERGVVLFRTRVLARDAVDHTYRIAPPERARPQERRSHPRTTEFPIDRVALDGRPAELVDLGPRGCRLRTASCPVPGTRVRVDLPWASEPSFGAVLEVRASSFDGGPGVEARLAFEQRVPLGFPA
ncbi:MAG: flagellar brake protein [Fimbriimonadales bacterium]|nr:flagellar brake protein [Fimbriimonadales bacterium]